MAEPTAATDQGIWQQASTWFNFLMGGGMAVTIAGWLRDRRKLSAEAAKLSAEATKAQADASVALSAVVDARLKLLIDGYESRIAELNEHIKALEKKVDDLEERLKAAQTVTGIGL